MITIAQLLKDPTNTTVCGLSFSIKTFKKLFQVEERWYQQVCLMDETGEILADVDVGETRNPLRGRIITIKILACMIQEGDGKNKLLVTQWANADAPISEPPDVPDLSGGRKEIRGKIKTWFIAAGIQNGQVKLHKGGFSQEAKDTINSLVDFAME